MSMRIYAHDGSPFFIARIGDTWYKMHVSHTKFECEAPRSWCEREVRKRRMLDVSHTSNAKEIIATCNKANNIKEEG